MSGVYTAGCMLGIKYLAVKAQDKLCCTDTDTCIAIGRIRIRGYGNFLNNLIRGYVYYLKNKIKK